MEQWKNGLRESMEGFRMDSPDGLWDSIEASVPAKRRHPAVFWSIPAAAAAAIAIAVIFMHRPSTSAPELIADNITYLPGTEAIDIPGKAFNPGPAGQQETAHSHIAEIVRNSAGTATEEQYRKLTEEGADSGTACLDQQNMEELPSGKKWTEDKGWTKSDAWTEDHDIKRRRHGKLSGSIGIGGAPGGRDSHAGYGEAMASRSMLSSFSFGEDPMADIAAYNMDKEIMTSTRHYQPIRAGVTLRYTMGRIGIESGVMYSCLISRIRSGSSSYYYTGNQKLHYIGIPLNVSYSIWSTPKAAVYVSAGGTMEKCAGGSLRTEYTYNGATGAPQYEKLRIKPLQWSVQAAAGIQYSITDFLGIYVEPGVSYHFKNGSDIESAYTAHPLDFSLGIGVRFSIKQ